MLIITHLNSLAVTHSVPLNHYAMLQILSRPFKANLDQPLPEHQHA